MQSHFREETPTAEIAEIIVEYATKYHTHIQESMFDATKNTVSSPLGAWLLTAIVAGSSETFLDEPTKQKINTILGTSISHAYSLANKLLSSEHENINNVFGAWFDETIISKVQHWASVYKKNSDINFKPYKPTHEEADEWVEESTLGLIKKFPVDVEDKAILAILTNIIATKIQWSQKFTPVKNTMNAWGTNEVLHGNHHTAGLITDDEATYGYHIASSSYVNVLSLIGDDNISLEDLLQKAHDLVLEYTNTNNFTGSQDLSNTTNKGDFWNIYEEKREGYRLPEIEFNTFLPAWSSETEHDLNKSGLQFDVVSAPLQQAIQNGSNVPVDVSTSQVAVAHYDTNGFEAAAVTTMLFGATSAPVFEKKNILVFNLMFNKPYVVVAFARYAQRHLQHVEPKPESKWKGVPLFASVVNIAQEPEPRT